MRGADARGMLRVSLINARPGMVLGMPVYHPTLPGHVLLRPGFELDRAALDRLVELRVPQVWIRYPALDSVVKFTNPDIVHEQANVTALMGRALDAVPEGMHAELDYRQYAMAVRALVARLAANPDAALLVHDLVGAEAPFVMHCANVCFMSLLMGLKSEMYLIAQRHRLPAQHARNVENLGVGALLADIGVLRLPKDVYERWLLTGDDSDPEWQRHVKIGFGMVRGRVEPTASTAVLQHHQRFDGRGFPSLPPSGQPMRGQRIHVFARIIAVADLFDRLRNPPSARGDLSRRQPVVRVVNTILQHARRRLVDPIVVKALVHVAPPYPPGSMVRLNDGRAAVVTGFDPMEPCRPTVRTLLSTCADDLSEPGNLGPDYDLRITRSLSIVEIDGHEVRNDNFEAIDPTEFDLRVMNAPRANPTRKIPA